MKDKLRDAAADQIRHDADAKADLDSILDALRWGRPDDQASGEDPIGRYVPATDAAKLLHHEVSDALMDLKDASEPGWVKRTDSGRLNVRRWMSPGVNDDEVFDRYEPGQLDASEMEVVLLVDVSGSMASHTASLAESIWSIRQAVDDLEGRATVVTWDSGPHRILAQPNDRPDDRMFEPQAIGGTNPTTALSEAYRLLADSSATNRLMVLLSDGDWYGSTAEKVIDAMNAAGITTVFALFPTGYQRGGELDTHGCRYGLQISQLADLARLFRDVAVAQIGARL